jgi:membrane fusion protein (multidrug efflux system)
MADKVAVETVQETEERPNLDQREPNHAREEEAARPVHRRRRGLLASPGAKLVFGLILIVLIVGGYFLMRYFDSYEDTDDAQVYGHLMPLSARISGYVQKVNVDDNQYVTKGTVLVEIDPRDYQVAVEQAQAQLADAGANANSLNLNVPITNVNTTSQLSSSVSDLDSARAGVVAAQKQVAAAQAQLDQAEANNTKAQSDLMRYKQLVAKQEVSEQVYDQAVAAASAGNASVAAARASAAAADQAVTQAQARVTDAQASVSAAQTGPRQVAAIQARARSAEAMVKERQAALDQANLNLQYTKIIAPVDGVVMKNVEVGMNVQSGQQLISIVPLNEVWIIANFKETQLAKMHAGQQVDIHVDANGDTYKGRVDSIAAASGAVTSLLPPENATGNYVKVVQRIPVKIVLNPGEDKNHYLRLGMSVEPKVWIK